VEHFLKCLDSKLLYLFPFGVVLLIVSALHHLEPFLGLPSREQFF
jgi:hypothetical protein